VLALKPLGEKMMITERSRAIRRLTILAFVACLAGAAGADFYVAPGGNDAWSGTLAEPNADASDGPAATLKQAQLLVRALKAAQPDRRQPIVVAVRGGTYTLDEPIRFGPQDSGTEAAPVVYEACAGERPVLSGGRQITGWQLDNQGRWYVDLAEVKSGAWSFAQLFVDDQRRFRPRVPKQGYYQIAAQCEPSPKAAGRGHDRFGFAPGQIDPAWANLNDVEVIAFHNWATSRLRIASVDAESNVVTLSGNTQGNSSWAQLVKGHRFFAVNVREALGEPGQWYLDRPTGRLTYVPREGERPDRTVVVAPRLERLLLVAGDVEKRRFVEHVVFRGLTFAHTNWYTPPRGQSFPQAEINLGAAVAAMAARHVAFESCAIRHVGEYAIGFGLGCRDNRVEGCELVDLGAGGVKIGSALPSEWGDTRAAPGDEEALVSQHTIRNCLIAHGGRLHPAAVGVWIGHSPYNVVEHNEVLDFYYTGFSVGWVWGYSPSQAHHNDVGFNHVHDIGQGVLSDMGGIYTLGVSPGTVIHDNRFHDVVSFDYGGWGLYTDEGSTGIVMKNNVVYRCSRGCFHQHYGKENRVENNILAYGGQHQIQRTRTEEHVSFFFERNIVYWDNGSPLLGSNWRDDNFRLDYNDYYLTGDRPITFPGNLTFAQWQEKRGQDEHSIVADSRLVDPAKDDFRLQPDSPAFALGFKAFDQSRAGRTSPPVLTADLPPVPAGFE
jgi:hypothetical protein